FLARHFPPAVVDPVGLHVAAKRYLCAVEPKYLEQLSDSSRLSLELQGGPFRAEEVREFRALPHWHEAVRLRRYDDIGKAPGRRRDRGSRTLRPRSAAPPRRRHGQ